MKRRRWPKGTWMKLQSAATLAALMEQRRFSYDRLARYAGCSKSFISHLIKGRKNSCGVELAQNIAEALEVPLEVLFMPMTSAASGCSVSSNRTEAA